MKCYLSKVSDIKIFISGRQLKVPNGVFAGHTLPDELGSNAQEPDFLWPIRHEFLGESWTITSNADGRSFCAVLEKESQRRCRRRTRTILA
jgi:hypothetical protein